MWEVTVKYGFHIISYSCLTEQDALDWEHALRTTGHEVTVHEVTVKELFNKNCAVHHN